MKKESEAEKVKLRGEMSVDLELIHEKIDELVSDAEDISMALNHNPKPNPKPNPNPNPKPNPNLG